MRVLSINIIDYIETSKRIYDNVILYNHGEIRIICIKNVEWTITNAREKEEQSKLQVMWV
jgi:hypothetical protein